jgi:hypothetical protein
MPHQRSQKRGRHRRVRLSSHSFPPLCRAWGAILPSLLAIVQRMDLGQAEVGLLVVPADDCRSNESPNAESNSDVRKACNELCLLRD